MNNILECDCLVCALNGRQGRLNTVRNGKRYCTANPDFTKQLNSGMNKLVVEDYVLSFVDFKGVEQDFFIRSTSESDAVKQANLLLLVMGCNKRNASLIKEQVIAL